MACVSPPRASPLPLPSPELTPSPVATASAPLPRPHATLSPSQTLLLPASPAAMATLSPLMKSFVPADRSKAQHWSASSPCSGDGSSASPVASYQDALLSVPIQESTMVALPQLEVAPQKILLRSEVRRSSPR
jgi:hypothetical protein